MTNLRMLGLLAVGLIGCTGERDDVAEVSLEVNTSGDFSEVASIEVTITDTGGQPMCGTPLAAAATNGSIVLAPGCRVRPHAYYIDAVALDGFGRVLGAQEQQVQLHPGLNLIQIVLNLHPNAGGPASVSVGVDANHRASIAASSVTMDNDGRWRIELDPDDAIDDEDGEAAVFFPDFQDTAVSLFEDDLSPRAPAFLNTAPVTAEWESPTNSLYLIAYDSHGSGMAERWLVGLDPNAPESASFGELDTADVLYMRGGPAPDALVIQSGRDVLVAATLQPSPVGYADFRQFFPGSVAVAGALDDDTYELQIFDPFSNAATRVTIVPLGGGGLSTNVQVGCPAAMCPGRAQVTADWPSLAPITLARGQALRLHFLSAAQAILRDANTVKIGCAGVSELELVLNPEACSPGNVLTLNPATTPDFTMNQIHGFRPGTYTLEDPLSGKQAPITVL